MQEGQRSPTRNPVHRESLFSLKTSHGPLGHWTEDPVDRARRITRLREASLQETHRRGATRADPGARIERRVSRRELGDRSWPGDPVDRQAVGGLERPD
jgi:hypothetical protein